MLNFKEMDYKRTVEQLEEYKLIDNNNWSNRFTTSAEQLNNQAQKSPPNSFHPPNLQALNIHNFDEQPLRKGR